VRGKKRSEARLILILIDLILILVILTNMSQYRYGIDTSGIVAKPAMSACRIQLFIFDAMPNRRVFAVFLVSGAFSARHLLVRDTCLCQPQANATWKGNRLLVLRTLFCITLLVTCVSVVLLV
jgi:hypothetical protein